MLRLKNWFIILFPCLCGTSLYQCKFVRYVVYVESGKTLCFTSFLVIINSSCFFFSYGNFNAYGMTSSYECSFGFSH